MSWICRRGAGGTRAVAVKVWEPESSSLDPIKVEGSFIIMTAKAISMMSDFETSRIEKKERIRIV